MADKISCDLCGRSFANMKNLYRHKRGKPHEIELPNQRIKLDPEVKKERVKDRNRKAYQAYCEVTQGWIRSEEEQKQAALIIREAELLRREAEISTLSKITDLKVSLQHQGFALIHNVLSEEERNGGLSCVPESGFQKIFNGAERSMKKRFQFEIPIVPVPVHGNLINVIKAALVEHGLSFQTSRWAFLKSVPGCEEQEAHLDYNPSQISSCNPPHFCIASLQEGTKIVVWPGSHEVIKKYKLDSQRPDKSIKRTTVIIPPGSVVVLSQFLVHAGASYDIKNIRLHGYLETGQVDMGKTFILRKELRTEVANMFK